MALKKDYLVQKRNVLNELRANNMTVQELRFFSIYLSKINSKDTSTRIVRFPIDDFQKIMEYGRLNIAQLKATTNSLLCKVVNLPTDTGGYIGFQLFKKCRVDKDKNGEWYVEIDAHDDALPLMFEFKDKYFKYQLWNALRLRSPNQIRMYEVLKQYEKVGSRIISVDDLRELLGIGKGEYPRFGDFRVRVLDACQKALSEYTDIEFTYEPHGKRGNAGKILALKFTISKNADYADQLTLEEFIAMKDDDELEAAPKNRHEEIIEMLSDSCNNEFSKEQLEVLFDLVLKASYDESGAGLDYADYLSNKYHDLNEQAARKKIKSRFGYLKKIIESEV